MTGYEICCVICGEASTALFCEECRVLLSTKAPDAKAVDLEKPVTVTVAGGAND